LSAWDIDPAGVGGVWETVSGHLGDGEGGGLDGTIRDAETAMLDATTSVVSAPIEAELSNFFAHLGSLTLEMVERTASGLTGVADAVDAYVVGNYEMAEESQRGAGVIDSDTPAPPNL
jgi:hypothetical protein